MSERPFFRTTILPREILVIEEQGEKKIYLLKCSRRKLGELLEATLHPRSAHTA
jgi:hypothetical protein